MTVVYALGIVWLYATEPRSFKEVATGAQVAAGTYQVDQAKFDAALALFRREQFRAARDVRGRRSETRVKAQQLNRITPTSNIMAPTDTGRNASRH